MAQAWKASPPLCSLAMTEILSQRSWQDTLFPHHAAWDECNKQVHHQPKKTHIETTPRKGKKQQQQKKNYRKRNGAGQWLVVISPQISWQHISSRCLLCRQSSSPSDSALTCTCMLMPLSPICQSAHSLMGKKTARALQQCRRLPQWHLSRGLPLNPGNYSQLLERRWIFYILVLPLPAAKITLAALRLPRDDSNAKFILGYTEHHKTDSCKLQVYLICPWRPLFTSLFLKEEHPFTHG